MKTVFVVDDDAEQVELLTQALGAPNRRVRGFSDPIRALSALRTEPAHLLIADLSMPWIDGDAVVASARLRHPDLPIFLISGYSRGEQIAEKHGVRFFSKPVDFNALRQAVEDALSSPPSHAPSRG